jgi:hypothetical protein
MENEIIFYENPFYTIRQNVPELVWDFYFEHLKEEITALKLGFSQSQSFRQAVDRYSKGGRKYTTIYKVHFILKDLIIKVYPILNDNFWYGDGKQIGEAALQVAGKMLADFEALFNEQKSKLPKAA